MSVDSADSGTTFFRLDDSLVAWQLVDGSVVALDFDDSIYLSLNASGSVLWSRVAVGATRRQLEGELLARFEVTSEQAVADVDTFLRRCEDLHLLRK